jgi:adenylate cyclase
LLAFAYYLRGDYQTSLDEFRRWDNNNYDRGFANLAACLAQVGRIDEAKAAWRSCLDVTPGYTIEDYKRGSPYRRKEDLEHWLDGLRKAGVGDEKDLGIIPNDRRLVTPGTGTGASKNSFN